MNLKVVTVTALMLFIAGCVEKPQSEFYITQGDRELRGDAVVLEKEPFTIHAMDKNYSIAISKGPIVALKNRHTLVKHWGTFGAWNPDKVPFLYEKSDLLSDKGVCLPYRNQREACQEFIQQKREHGFGDEYTYTFTEYLVDDRSVTLKQIGTEPIANLESGVYYLYLFRSTVKLGKMARVQSIHRIKMTLK